MTKNKKEAPLEEASTTSITQIVEEIKPQAQKGLEFANKILIRSQKDLEVSKEFLSKIGTFKKDVQAKKDGIVKPLNEALKNAKALFSPIEDYISQAEYKVKSQMLSWNQKVQAELVKKEAEVTKAVEAGVMPIATAGAKIERAQAKVEAIPTRKVQKLQIVDANLVPKEYWVIDEVLLRSAALLAKQGGREIPGVKIVEEEIIVMR